MISYLFYLNYFLIVPSKLKKCVRNHFKPLTLKGDWHLISPYNITSESNNKVKRI